MDYSSLLLAYAAIVLCWIVTGSLTIHAAMQTRRRYEASKLD